MLFANIKLKVKIITILTIINVYQPPPPQISLLRLRCGFWQSDDLESYSGVRAATSRPSHARQFKGYDLDEKE
jgi:hypothetical protein